MVYTVNRLTGKASFQESASLESQSHPPGRGCRYADLFTSVCVCVNQDFTSSPNMEKKVGIAAKRLECHAIKH